MKLNRKQKLAIFSGATASIFLFLFPPWNFGSVRLPYQIKWPPRTPPSISITGYPPFSFMVNVPNANDKTLEAVNKEAAKSFEASDINDFKAFEAQAAAVFGKVHIDWQRFILIQVAVIVVTFALVIMTKQRHS